MHSDCGRRLPLPNEAEAFHLRVYNLGEKGSRSQIVRFLFHGACRPLGVYIHPTSLPKSLLQLRSQTTVEIHHATLSSFPWQLQLRRPDQLC
jgi:hypothetical protein